jgi:hypothetical protein
LDETGVKYDDRIHPVPFRPTVRPLVGNGIKRRRKRKMKKYYLPAIASLLILAITASSFLPVLAQGMPTRATVAPSLVVTTIAEDDEVHKTGIMLMGSTIVTSPNELGTGTRDLLAQFKVLVTYNGVPRTPATFICQFIEKDKFNPIKFKQFTAENVATDPVWVNDFVCKLRWGKEGVGVIDVYYLGELVPAKIADYIMVVWATMTVGRTALWGTEMQDLCLLGWPMATDGQYTITKPDGDLHVITPNPFGTYDSCDDITLYQKHVILGFPMSTLPWG